MNQNTWTVFIPLIHEFGVNLVQKQLTSSWMSESFRECFDSFDGVRKLLCPPVACGSILTSLLKTPEVICSTQLQFTRLPNFVVARIVRRRGSDDIHNVRIDDLLVFGVKHRATSVIVRNGSFTVQHSMR